MERREDERCYMYAATRQLVIVLSTVLCALLLC